MPDLSITLTFPEAEVPESRAAFFKIFPNNQKKENGDPYTDLEHFKKVIDDYVTAKINQGKLAIAKEACKITPTTIN